MPQRRRIKTSSEKEVSGTDRPHASRPPNSLIGEESQCIWMKAGLIAYKLCDREFDCEHCAFDAAMQGMLPQADSAEQEPLTPRDSWSFPGDRVFHPAHTWAQARAGNRIRVGLDAFAAHLIRQSSSVIFPPPESLLEASQPGCWLVDEIGPIPIRMPVTGSLVRQNNHLQTWPKLSMQKPYSDGWLMEIAPADGAQEWARLLNAVEMQKNTEADWKKFTTRARSFLETGKSAVGPTLPDGGERLTDLENMLGRRKYRNLVLELL